MTDSVLGILGGVISAFLLGFALGYAFRAAREVVKIATSAD